MPEFDPSDPVDAREIARRLATIGTDYSHVYIAQNLSRQHGFPAAGGYELNGGRWWRWGEVLDWFTARAATPPK
jgi:hypothetical protein